MSTYTPIDFNELKNNINKKLKTTDKHYKEFINAVNNYFHVNNQIKSINHDFETWKTFFANDAIQNDIKALKQQINSCNRNYRAMYENELYSLYMHNCILLDPSIVTKAVNATLESVTTIYNDKLKTLQKSENKKLEKVKKLKTDEIIEIVKIDDNAFVCRHKEFILTV